MLAPGRKTKRSITALAAAGAGIFALSADVAQAKDASSGGANPNPSAREWVVQLDGAGTDALKDLAGIGAVERAGLLPNAYVVRFDASLDATGVDRVLRGRRGGRLGAMQPLVARQHFTRSVPNDTLFPQQWHLLNTGQNGGATPGADANVVGVWDTYKGTGVRIAIVDDGLQGLHPDLAPNYSGAISWDYNYNDNDPTPDDPFDNHGTSVAGVAAARGGNGFGVSGAAPMATVGGIRLISQATTDAQDAKALSHMRDVIDIYSNSWGPQDGAGQAGPGMLTKAALQQGATLGRGGKGNIFVFAGGNGAGARDNVNYDGYANSRHTIAVAAIDDRGVQASYSEPGAPLLISAYSDSSGRPGITTTDRTGSAGYSNNDYTNSFGGTSSATPLVSGVAALMLEANPNLTARDVQHILVKTAEKNDPSGAGWTNNGAGLHVNHRYGFGAVDAAAAVAAAQTWTNVGPEVSVFTQEKSVGAALADNNTNWVTDTITVAENIRIEWVEIDFEATHTYRGDLAIELVSPMGTTSVLAALHGDAGNDYDWTFTSARHWDEFSAGMWTLKVADVAAQDLGTWDAWSLNFFGTAVPEPSALSLLAVAAAAVLRRRRR